MCWIVHIFILDWQILCTAVHASVQHPIFVVYAEVASQVENRQGAGIREGGGGGINGTLRYLLLPLLCRKAAVACTVPGKTNYGPQRWCIDLERSQASKGGTEILVSSNNNAYYMRSGCHPCLAVRTPYTEHNVHHKLYFASTAGTQGHSTCQFAGITQRSASVHQCSHLCRHLQANNKHVL